MTTSAANTTSISRQCEATNKAGQRCQAPALHGSTFCWHHDPAHAAQRAAARRKGGRAKAGREIRHIIENDPPPAALGTHGDMLEALEYALAVAFGLEPSNQSVRSIVAVVQAAAKIYEVSEYAARLEALETQVNDLRTAVLVVEGGGNGRH